MIRNIETDPKTDVNIELKTDNYREAQWARANINSRKKTLFELLGLLQSLESVIRDDMKNLSEQKIRHSIRASEEISDLGNKANKLIVSLGDYFERLPDEVRHQYWQQEHGYCFAHEQPYQEINPDEWLCESCLDSVILGYCACCHKNAEIIEHEYCRSCWEIYKNEVNT